MLSKNNRITLELYVIIIIIELGILVKAKLIILDGY